MKVNKISTLEKEIEKMNQVLKEQKKQIDELSAGYFEWCDVFAIAKMLGLSKRTVDEQRKAGMIPYSKLGSRIYFRKIDIHNILIQNLGTQTQKS